MKPHPLLITTPTFIDGTLVWYELAVAEVCFKLVVYRYLHLLSWIREEYVGPFISSTAFPCIAYNVPVHFSLT